jgi:hypothetical protein
MTKNSSVAPCSRTLVQSAPHLVRWGLLGVAVALVQTGCVQESVRPSYSGDYRLVEVQLSGDGTREGVETLHLKEFKNTSAYVSAVLDQHPEFQDYLHPRIPKTLEVIQHPFNPVVGGVNHKLTVFSTDQELPGTFFNRDLKGYYSGVPVSNACSLNQINSEENIKKCQLNEYQKGYLYPLSKPLILSTYHTWVSERSRQPWEAYSQVAAWIDPGPKVLNQSYLIFKEGGSGIGSIPYAWETLAPFEPAASEWAETPIRLTVSFKTVKQLREVQLTGVKRGFYSTITLVYERAVARDYGDLRITDNPEILDRIDELTSSAGQITHEAFDAPQSGQEIRAMYPDQL